jgi:hypothetical protein
MTKFLANLRKIFCQKEVEFVHSLTYSVTNKKNEIFNNTINDNIFLFLVVGLMSISISFLAMFYVYH